MPLVTLSASYGAGGSQIGPALARRLDVPFLDRAIPADVAERLAVPLGQALEHDQCVSGLFERFLQSFVPVAGNYAGPFDVPDEARLGDREFCAATEAVIREHASRHDGVLLGRAAAIILCDDPVALHVRLDGPPARRVAQAMRLEGIDRETAERRRREADHAREAYVRHFYRAEIRDPAHFHLVLDTTAIDLDTCVEVVACAAAGRA